MGLDGRGLNSKVPSSRIGGLGNDIRNSGMPKASNQIPTKQSGFGMA
jgi:hypothetical protein